MAIARRMGLGIAILLGCAMLLAAGAIVLLNTGFAHRYILRLVTDHLQDATGGSVEIGVLSFHRGHPGADFYRIKIYSDSSDSGTPVLSADRAAIDLGLHLLHVRKVEIDNVTLDHPVVHLAINSQGISNLPHPAKSSGSSTNLFDMAISHFVLNGGELFYNDRRTPVTADVRDLNARATYENWTRTYDGTLSYRDARVQYGTFAPFTHDLQLSLAATSTALTIKSLELRSGPSWVKAQGQLSNYENPSLQGSYEASLASGELTNLVRASATQPAQSIAGQVDTKGTFAYRSNPDVAAIDKLSLAGTLSAQSLKLISPKIRWAVQNLAVNYELDKGNLEANKLQADTLGGQVTGDLLISNLMGKAVARLDADAHGIALSAVRDALRDADVSRVHVDGRLDANMHATWQGSGQDIQLVSNAHLAGTVTSASNAGDRSDSFPLTGAAQLTYNGPKQLVTVRSAFLNAPHNHVTMQGTLGNSANVNVAATSDDLREVDLLALLFRTNTSAAKNSAAPELLGLGGTGSFKGTVSGRLMDPRLSGVIAATNLRVRGASVQFLQTSIEASSRGIAAHQGELRISSQSRATFDVSVGLHDWNFTPQQPVTIHVNAAKVSAADLEHIAGFQYPIAGLVNATVSIDGTEENPDVRGNIHLTQASLWQQPVQDLSVEIQNAENLLQTKINVQTPAGVASGSMNYDPKTLEYDLQVGSPAIRLDQIQYLQERSQKVAGVINVSARGHGNVKDPQVEVAVGGRQLQIGEQKVEGFAAQASMAKQRAQFDVACSISGAALHARGAVNLTGDYEATANIDSQVIQLDSLLASFLPQTGTNLHGQTEFHGTLTGPLKNPSKIEARLEVPSFKIGYPQIQLAAVSPIHIDYQRGVLTVKRAELKGTGTDVTLEATIPLQNAANLQATANGRVDLQLLQIWNPQWRCSGQIDLKLGVQGTRAHPEVSGTLAVSDAAIAIESVPTLEKMNGELDVNGERVQVKSLQGQLGGGSFEVHGFATYKPTIQYNLGMTASGVRLFYPDGVRTQLSANLNFTGQPANSYLTGQATVNRLSLMQSFDLASFSNQFNAPSAPSTGMAQNVKLNIGLSSSQQLELAGNQLSIQGTADLRIEGTAAEPVIIGRTNLTSGEFFLNGRRFQIQNASIEFANPVRTDPVLNLTATTEVNQFNLTINLVGPFDRLRTTYTSDPPLAPVDVINLLIAGQTTEAVQNTSTTPQSVIAGQLAGQVSDRLQKLTGISSLTIDPQLGGNQGNGASQLAIQERVTKNLFFTFATDVTTTQGEVVQVEYQITRKYSMSAIRDQTGGYQIEIKSHKTF